MKQLIHFLLVPDGSAARRLRRMLATQAPCQGILVGTWPELIEQAKSAYLLSPQTSDWNKRFHSALETLSDAFWSNSFEVSPAETAAEVEAALSVLVGATEAGSEIVIADSDQLAERPRKHVQDIVRLLHELDGLLPDELLAIQQLLSTASNIAIRQLAVCRVEDFPSLTRWQVALIDKLNADAEIERDVAMMRLPESLLLDAFIAVRQTCLQALQQRLFTVPEEKTPLDTTVQWLGVRDFLEKAEVAKATDMSRSAFADRFTGLVGMPPIRYLSHWRLQLVAVRLRECPRAIPQIAYEVGYKWEAAFSRAFKQAFGVTPGRWRRYESDSEPSK